MYELKKKIGKVLTSKSVGTGPSSYEKKNLPGRGLTKVEKHWCRDMSGVCLVNYTKHCSILCPTLSQKWYKMIAGAGREMSGGAGITH